MEKTLRPIIDKDIYSEIIWHEIEKIMFEALYLPLFDAIGFDINPKKIVKRNAKEDLIQAISRGTIQYVSGKFFGKFNSTVSRELKKLGATYDVKEKAYKIAETKLSQELRIAISSAKAKFHAQGEKIMDTVTKLNPKPQIDPLRLSSQLKAVQDDLEKQFKLTTPKDLSVPIGLTPYVKNRLQEEYVYNLNRYMDDFSKKEIVKIRETVSKYVAMGYRADRMAKALTASYGQTQRKAKFLARQETSLMVSKYREARYGEAGINTYKWSTSHDERVRPDHKLLNNRVFRFDDPPITDRATGARNNPGEDFNCRCVALPIYKESVKAGQETGR